MKIVLFSKQSFLVNEAKKSIHLEDFSFVNKIENLFETLNSNTILLYHIDCDDNSEENLKEIKEDFENIKIAIFRNNTNNIEGCSLLKKGFKAYAHAMSNINIIEDIIKAISNGNIWMYPELMQFLISSVPVENQNEKELLKELTPKELEVLELVAQGLNNAKIAQTLDLAEVSVKKYISSLFKKLDKKDRLSLALLFKSISK
ncbi:response regulator transcription factor [Halarcobacter ebronensis]|uniref:HTH luxR-type domain-containing protein n=1 Tax=Halarcobacter ebronensis TaxID=1462615 RepID=A0A4Q1AM53_9BACT|nr:response regulator transcription factor [Halarcobacter ebronensis]QKF81758.1 DNA-binding response regulator, NarL/FixJ family [Halarcobacter ebronensis]RXK04566.1 hypothetical protein CRV07_10445 [Halarcobacter ebronensis]